jgi:gamma-glutamylcyclotransferase
LRLLYFAYGSNLATAEMEAWCPDHRFLGPARVDGYRLGLRRRSIRWGAGVLDLVAARGATVWGALYELPGVSLERLDAKEGAGFAYVRVEVEPVLDGGRHRAVAYEVVEKEPEQVPCSPEYAQLVLAGARERTLPDEWLRKLEAGLAAGGAGKTDR